MTVQVSPGSYSESADESCVSIQIYDPEVAYNRTYNTVLYVVRPYKAGTDQITDRPDKVDRTLVSAAQQGVLQGWVHF